MGIVEISTGVGVVPVPDLRAFGVAVAVARRKLGLSLDAVTEASGASRKSLVNVEQGHKVPRLDTAHAIAHALAWKFQLFAGNDGVWYMEVPLWRGTLGLLKVKFHRAERHF